MTRSKKDPFGHDKLIYNPLQEETAKYVDEDCNVVVMEIYNGC